MVLSPAQLTLSPPVPFLPPLLESAGLPAPAASVTCHRLSAFPPPQLPLPGPRMIIREPQTHARKEAQEARQPSGRLSSHPVVC